MNSSLRHSLIDALWQKHLHESQQANAIHSALQQNGVEHIVLDHFAMIDLPSVYSGIPVMQVILERLGFEKRGQGYLADKQNDFSWFSEENIEQKAAYEALPQIVIADFRLDELPVTVADIIRKYAKLTKPFAFAEFDHLLGEYHAGDDNAATNIVNLLVNYFSGRDWPLPTFADFAAVSKVNELLAWVLLFGRRPNHFTFSVHLMNKFQDLDSFNHFVTTVLQFPLNHEGGVVKGSQQVGITQSSTEGEEVTVRLNEGNIMIRKEFVEFVYRYPVVSTTSPRLWQDYFPDFIAAHANYVIESLYA